MTAPDLHRDLTAALDAEQQQLCRCGGSWSVCADTTARAQQLIDLRRDIAERHTHKATDWVWCGHCRYAWPCPDYLAAARATLPADHPALTA